MQIPLKFGIPLMVCFFIFLFYNQSHRKSKKRDTSTSVITQLSNHYSQIKLPSGAVLKSQSLIKSINNVGDASVEGEYQYDSKKSGYQFIKDSLLKNGFILVRETDANGLTAFFCKSGIDAVYSYRGKINATNDFSLVLYWFPYERMGGCNGPMPPLLGTQNVNNKAPVSPRPPVSAKTTAITP